MRQQPIQLTRDFIHDFEGHIFDMKRKDLGISYNASDLSCFHLNFFTVWIPESKFILNKIFDMKESNYKT